MPTLTVEHDCRTGAITFTGTMVPSDFNRLYKFDRIVVDDCEGEGRTPADFLLAAELIFRRAEEEAALMTQRGASDPQADAPARTTIPAKL